MGGDDLLIEPWPLPDAPHAVTSAIHIESAADRIVTARVLTTVANNIREGRMPPLIEIKGLGNIVADARKAIAGVRSETTGLNTDAVALVAAVKDVRAQIRQAHDDLKFEAETLGNGGATDSETTVAKSEG